MRARALILSFLLLTAAPLLRAQWSGSLDFSSGLGGILADERVGAGGTFSFLHSLQVFPD